MTGSLVFCLDASFRALISGEVSSVQLDPKSYVRAARFNINATVQFASLRGGSH
jgi:hypothetical protein